MKKVIKIFSIIIIMIDCIFIFSGCNITGIIKDEKNKKSEINNYINNNINKVQDSINTDSTSQESNTDIFSMLESRYKEGESYILSKDEIGLSNTDGKGKNYSFNYNNETYTAVYTKDNWHINNSYKIKNKKDITLICEALNDVHKVHGKDMKSYRTAEDMMEEWVIHNIAYDYLPEENNWKSHAKDVDLNPADQGKSLKEMYEEKVNKK